MGVLVPLVCLLCGLARSGSEGMGPVQTSMLSKPNVLRAAENGLPALRNKMPSAHEVHHIQSLERRAYTRRTVVPCLTFYYVLTLCCITYVCLTAIHRTWKRHHNSAQYPGYACRIHGDAA